MNDATTAIEIIGTRQAAEMLGVSPAAVRGLIHRGERRAQKLGGWFLVRRSPPSRHSRSGSALPHVRQRRVGSGIPGEAGAPFCVQNMMPAKSIGDILCLRRLHSAQAITRFSGPLEPAGSPGRGASGVTCST